MLTDKEFPPLIWIRDDAIQFHINRNDTCNSTSTHFISCKQHEAIVEKLNEQVKLLQEAAEFYADGEGEVLNWDGVNNYAYMQVKGKRAKEALQKLQEMKEKK